MWCCRPTEGGLGVLLLWGRGVDAEGPPWGAPALALVSPSGITHSWGWG